MARVLRVLLLHSHSTGAMHESSRAPASIAILQQSLPTEPWPAISISRADRYGPYNCNYTTSHAACMVSQDKLQDGASVFRNLSLHWILVM